MNKFQVPEKRKIRVIIDTDAKNEADDQYAIVHALLTPKFHIKGLIGAHYRSHNEDNTMLKSCEECQHILRLMNLSNRIQTYHGAKCAIASSVEYDFSEGAELIVREALAEDEAPLFVVFQGPITDLACAYLRHPEIVGKLTAIWIGGGRYPEGGFEYNLSNDIQAANIVFQSGIELWQVPSNVYGRMLVSLTELEAKVAPCGKLGKYLFDQMIQFNNEHTDIKEWPSGESWTLGDSPVVGLMMEPMKMFCEMREAPVIDEEMKYYFTGKNPFIRVYNDINCRFILEDFFSKLLKYSQDMYIEDE